MNQTAYIISAIAIMSLVTIAIRVSPFVFLRAKRRVGGSKLSVLSQYLPAMIMVILSVYTLKETEVFRFPYGVPEGGALLFTVVLQWYRRNFLLSLFLGTLLYMVLIRCL